MCGIVGYIGPKDVVPILIGGLKRLEYRGYDSAGVAVIDHGALDTRRAAGKIAMLEAALGAAPVSGHLGIGHTRWATHGPPTDRNAHPHLSTDGTIAVVHNGIIENYGSLKTQLAAKGHRFSSDTDTEVLACLIQECYEGSLEEAVISALRLVEGTYGIAVVSSREPQKIVGARQGSPLLVGVSDGEYFLASDASAILAHTRDVVYLNEGEIAVLTPDGYRLMNIDAAPVRRSVETIAWDLDAIERGGYDHFMLKEIFEQPTTVANTLRGRLRLEEGTSKLGGLNLSHEQLMGIDQIIITACGTSWHSGLIGELMIEDMARIPVRRDRRHPRRDARGQAAWGAHPRSRERGRIDHRPRGRRWHLSACGAGDRCGLHQGLQQPGRRARPPRAQARTEAEPLRRAGA